MLPLRAMCVESRSSNASGALRLQCFSRARRIPGQFVPAQSGQALTETLVFALVAVGMLFGVLLIGRLHAIQASAIGAARAHAFECRLEIAGCDDPVRAAQLAAVIRARHFAGSELSSSGTASGGSGAPPRVTPHPFWTNPDRAPMVRSLDSVSVSSSPLSLSAGVNVATAAERAQGLNGIASLSALPERFGLDASAGFRASRIEIPVHASLSGTGGASSNTPLSLPIRARLAIVGNEWNASQSLGPASDSLQSRVERGARLDSFREAALDAGYAVPRALLRAADSIGIEPGGSALASHRLDVTVVPRDRRP